MKIFSKMISSITIGVLGIQGSIQEHIDLLQIAISRMSLRTGIKTRTVGKADDLHGVDGLIIPGGESTTLKKFLNEDFLNTLQDWREGGRTGQWI
ncbi:uncharacterized protein LOC111707432 isoform X2 [Eurytemora carolleeae]|uniref:uncharacterized protein LOC111707432 isoform X2 n=1 Tax=Eurytemora carolleeae TaxID=1294199 RepID=UPI000C756774|nr:uncharacterized protein LOC111707432 isoform X2 [Eurytemora carolleeae]|eukprot:XP_023336307.1 uncharacterized protein LOC111707432 isoform X2 [Eurytemora affinis]